MNKFEAALKWTDDAFADIEESRVKLRRSNEVLDRAENCLKTIRTALTQAAEIERGDKVVVPANERAEMLAAIVELRGALETIANDHDWNLNARAFAADSIAKANTEKWV